jgi:hypothetical protein
MNFDTLMGFASTVAHLVLLDPSGSGDSAAQDGEEGLHGNRASEESASFEYCENDVNICRSVVEAIRSAGFTSVLIECSEACQAAIDPLVSRFFAV